MNILVLNCGSSSIKFQVIDPESRQRLVGGLVSEIGTPAATLTWTVGAARQAEACGGIGYEEGIARILARVQGVEGLGELVGIGHRVVHGGERFSDSTRITPEVIAEIEACIPLAPLHNPANLQGILTCQALLPALPQVAVFDTAFHQSLPPHAYLYALPYELYERHRIRRYGFHGTSHRYVTGEASAWLGRAGNFISLHLGNGASVTAIQEGRSVDTSMGFTPLEGLVMGTRSGDLDPSLLPFLAQHEGLTLAEVETMLNKQSGLRGLSGGESDMQGLLAQAAQGHAPSERAIALFCYRAKKYIGAYLAALGQVDALIFTGGIGENAAPIRARICAGLEPLGIALNSANNSRGKETTVISAPDSRIAVLVIPTNEELLIALDTWERVRE